MLYRCDQLLLQLLHAIAHILKLPLSICFSRPLLAFFFLSVSFLFAPACTLCLFLSHSFFILSLYSFILFSFILFFHELYRGLACSVCLLFFYLFLQLFTTGLNYISQRFITQDMNNLRMLVSYLVVPNSKQNKQIQLQMWWCFVCEMTIFNAYIVITGNLNK